MSANIAGTAILRDVTLDVPDGTRTVLVGPSGAGKTTLLRAIAGLTQIQEGSIGIGNRDVHSLPAHERRCAVVFQEPRLLAHLDVADNVALPLRAARVGRAERRRRAAALLDDVGLGGLGQRRVQGLSGGEQQRVALARALSAQPELLMLDEPLSAVDPNRREGLRRLICDLQRERSLTTLLITHDRAEAAQLGERIALMLEGRIVQCDTPRVLFERPDSPVVARFFGSPNILRGDVRAGSIELDCGAVPVTGPDGEACITIRPERIRLDPEGSLELQVVEGLYLGTHVQLTLRCGNVTITAHVDPAQAPSTGEWTRVALPADSVWRIARADGEVPTAHPPSQPS